MSAPTKTDPVPKADFDGFVALLRERGPALPKRLKQVADHALAHPEDMALNTAAQIAEKVGVQASTLVRFAQALDYSGFSELQQIFRTRLRTQSPDYRDRLEALRAEGAAGDDMGRILLDGFIAASETSLRRLRDAVDAAEIEAAAALLAGADTIVLIGARRMFPIVSYLAYAFGKLGLRAVLVDNVGMLGAEQAAFARPGDVVFAVSCAPYTAATLKAAAAAQRAGVPVIGLTDSALSPLGRHCRLAFTITEADYGAFRSLAASLAFAMTLAVATAEKAGQAPPPVLS